MYWKRRLIRLTPEKRIKELDFARGFCILAMVFVHLIYDLTELYSFLPQSGPVFSFVKNYGSLAFFLISGICATLGHKYPRRGLLVLGCGLLVSLVTALTGFPVRFGVLQCLGISMILWHSFKTVSSKTLLICSTGIIALGKIFEGSTVVFPWLYPFGLTVPDFESADFFPLFPYFGYFLLGAVFGRVLYGNRRSLLQNCGFSSAFSRFLCFCGRHSLLLYLIHQPLLILLIESAVFIGGHFHEV